MFEAPANFSEGRDAGLLAELGAGDSVLDVHADADHHRSVVTLAACDPSRLVDELVELVRLVSARVDLASHRGVHPRVGVADVLPIVPLGSASLEAAVAAARRLGERVWGELGIPVYFYGAAGGGRRLAEIRRGGVEPDLGGPDGHPWAGFCCVGARRPLVAYNVAFAGLDRGVVRDVARAMRRLPRVQALTFPLSDGRVQLSMNLTEPAVVGAAAAFGEAVRLAGVAGEPELVGLCPAAAAGPGCDGGLLEAHLAALAARRGGAMARARGGDELERLATKLDAQAMGLPALPATGPAILDGAEKVVAIRRVLGAAGIDDTCLDSVLGVAAVGLRAALGEDVALRHGERVRLLDRWLEETWPAPEKK